MCTTELLCDFQLSHFSFLLHSPLGCHFLYSYCFSLARPVLWSIVFHIGNVLFFVATITSLDAVGWQQGTVHSWGGMGVTNHCCRGTMWLGNMKFNFCRLIRIMQWWGDIFSGEWGGSEDLVWHPPGPQLASPPHSQTQEWIRYSDSSSSFCEEALHIVAVM